MKTEEEITPEELFRLFRDAFFQNNITIGINALSRFKQVKDKSAFLNPTKDFISKEVAEDQVISWGTNVLEIIGGDEAFQFLIDLLDKHKTKELKRSYLYTRFFALRALKVLSIDNDKIKNLTDLIQKIWRDNDEDYLVRAMALAILAKQGDDTAKSEIKTWLSDPKDFWRTLRMLRALCEFSLPDFNDLVIAVLRNSDFSDHKYKAIKVLGNSNGDLKVVRSLGEVARTDTHPYLRLLALNSLAKLGNKESIIDLLHCLADENAENRVQASASLKSILKEESIPIIIGEALKEDTDKNTLKYFIESLRYIDQDRNISANILSRELTNEDRRRAQTAEKMLIELGGWMAVQRLNQRRDTLKALDNLLKDSEDVVKKTFEGTIRQARTNFYFALGVNILVVITGIALVVIAVGQVLKDPNTLQKWLVPGGAGIFSLIINMYFNDPRKNAREDLTTLINVNVIFLGFLRQLNEIDATFKHYYLESQDFGTDQMQITVTQINTAMNLTLTMAERYLAVPRTIMNKEDEEKLQNLQGTRVREN